jgi:hypothetical protein
MIAGAGRILIRLSDARRKGAGDAAREERSDVHLLPSFEVGADDKGDLGVELHDGAMSPVSVSNDSMSTGSAGLPLPQFNQLQYLWAVTRALTLQIISLQLPYCRAGGKCSMPRLSTT